LPDLTFKAAAGISEAAKFQGSTPNAEIATETAQKHHPAPPQ